MPFIGETTTPHAHVRRDAARGSDQIGNRLWMRLPPLKQLVASTQPVPETEMTLQTTGKRRNRRFHYKGTEACSWTLPMPANGKCCTVPKRVMRYMVSLIDEPSFSKNSAHCGLRLVGVSQNLSIIG